MFKEVGKLKSQGRIETISQKRTKHEHNGENENNMRKRICCENDKMNSSNTVHFIKFILKVKNTSNNLQGEIATKYKQRSILEREKVISQAQAFHV